MVGSVSVGGDSVVVVVYAAAAGEGGRCLYFSFCPSPVATHVELRCTQHVCITVLVRGLDV